MAGRHRCEAALAARPEGEPLARERERVGRRVDVGEKVRDAAGELACEIRIQRTHGFHALYRRVYRLGDADPARVFATF